MLSFRGLDSGVKPFYCDKNGKTRTLVCLGRNFYSLRRNPNGTPILFKYNLSNYKKDSNQ